MRATFSLDDLLTEDQQLALRIVAEIERLDPEVAAWLREPAAIRGPRPLCDARVADLVLQALALVSG